MEQNFEQLAQQAFGEDAQHADKDQLWKAVFELEEWYGIPRGSQEQPYPFAAYLDEQRPVFLLFTDAQQAKAYSTTHELSPAGTAVQLLSLLPQDAIQYLMPFEQHGIWGVWFNPGSTGFYAPLSGLKNIYEQLSKK